jgi:hypothetical protein
LLRNTLFLLTLPWLVLGATETENVCACMCVPAARIAALARGRAVRRRLLSAFVVTMRQCHATISSPLLHKPSPVVSMELQDKDGLVRLFPVLVTIVPTVT